MNDLEKQLSDVLHELTPEPPPFRLAPVDELGTVVRERRGEGSRRRRTFGRPLLAAAAAVTVLGVGGAVALVAGGGSGTRPGGAPVARCAGWKDIDVNLSTPVVRGSEVLARFVLFSSSGHPCALAGPTQVGLQPDVVSSTPGQRSVPVEPSGQLVVGNAVPLLLDVRLSVVGSCQRSDERPLDPAATHQPGLVLAAPFGRTTAYPLGLFGCRLTPISAMPGKEP